MDLGKDMNIPSNNGDGFKLGSFSSKAKDFLFRSDSFINILHGSVRSGKTIVATFRFLIFILESTYDEFMISGKTRDTIERNIVRDLIRMIEGRGIHYEYKKYENYLQIADKTIWLIGFSDEGATEKVRGMTIGGWYADEVTSAAQSTVEMAISRCSVQGAKIFWTMNPQSPYHFIFTDFINNQELLQSGTVRVWHFTLEDNTHLSQEYVEELKRVNQRSQIMYKRNILGEWVVAEGAIYDSFDTRRHVFTDNDKTIDDMDLVNICCDYGVSSVTVFGVMGVTTDNHAGNEYWLLEEDYYDATVNGVTQTDTERLETILRLQDKYNLNRKNILFLPHDASSLKATCRKSKRLKMKVRTYRPDTYKDILTIQDLINNDRFHIHKSCKNSITQAQTYSWDLKSQQKGLDKPLKINDHCPDMWRGGIIGIRHKGRKVIV